MSLVDDVLDFLEAEGLVAGTSDYARAAGYLPPTPDEVVAVFETGGPPPVLAPEGSSEERLDEPTFQVRGRAGRFGYQGLRDRMESIYRALHESDLGASTNPTNYLVVRAEQSGPFPLGLDENDRPGLTWNFSVIRRRPAP